MGLSSAERGVLKVVEKLGEAHKGTMSRKMVVSKDYIDRMCGSRTGLWRRPPAGDSGSPRLGKRY